MGMKEGMERRSEILGGMREERKGRKNEKIGNGEKGDEGRGENGGDKYGCCCDLVQ